MQPGPQPEAQRFERGPQRRRGALQTADAMVAAGLVRAGELDRFLELLEDPGFTVRSYLVLTTSGRRPVAVSSA